MTQDEVTMLARQVMALVEAQNVDAMRRLQRLAIRLEVHPAAAFMYIRNAASRHHPLDDTITMAQAMQGSFRNVFHRGM